MRISDTFRCLCYSYLLSSTFLYFMRWNALICGWPIYFSFLQPNWVQIGLPDWHNQWQIGDKLFKNWLTLNILNLFSLITWQPWSQIRLSGNPACSYIFEFLEANTNLSELAKSANLYEFIRVGPEFVPPLIRNAVISKKWRENFS